MAAWTLCAIFFSRQPPPPPAALPATAASPTGPESHLPSRPWPRLRRPQESPGRGAGSTPWRCGRGYTERCASAFNSRFGPRPYMRRDTGRFRGGVRDSRLQSEFGEQFEPGTRESPCSRAMANRPGRTASAPRLAFPKVGVQSVQSCFSRAHSGHLDRQRLN
jgi:hypothetical protein